MLLYDLVLYSPVYLYHSNQNHICYDSLFIQTCLVSHQTCHSSRFVALQTKHFAARPSPFLSDQSPMSYTVAKARLHRNSNLPEDNSSGLFNRSQVFPTVSINPLSGPVWSQRKGR
ncbi:putative alpha-glucuronidase A [Fusarium oxysporum f. sp. albedinis]|nr:putative alpha-glucuronidase A [Fusarium oxysporum f. sp. albedinis]